MKPQASRAATAGNGAAEKSPAPYGDLEAARVVVAAGRGRRDPDPEIARRLAQTPEWHDGAILAAQDGPAGVERWLAVLRIRLRSDPGRFAAYQAALEAAQAEPPATIALAEARDGSRPFELELVDSEAFFGEEHHLDWHARGILVRGETCVVGGPSKSLKTSILIDLAYSLGTGTPFLGRFSVPEPRRVALISGESGRRVIQLNARQVVGSRDFPKERLKNVFVGFRLPQLTDAEHLDAIRREIIARRLDVVCLDPLYLSLLAGSTGIDPKSMFDMGPVLGRVAETCLEAGATPILCHHSIKRRESPYDPLALEDLAFAGIGQYMRQWMLIARRERYDPTGGIHRLHFGYGGSAGHAGELHLDVETGLVDETFAGRRWVVTVSTPAESLADREADREADRRRKDAEKVRQADERSTIRLQADAEKIRQALASFLGDRIATVSALSAHANMSGARANAALAYLETTGHVEQHQAEVANGRSRRQVTAYRLTGGRGPRC